MCELSTIHFSRLLEYGQRLVDLITCDKGRADKLMRQVYRRHWIGEGDRGGE